MIIPENFITYINYGLIGFLIVAIIVGLVTGFLRQCISLFGTIIAFVCAKIFAPILSNSVLLVKLEMLPNELGNLKNIVLEKANYFAWFALIFLGLFILFKILAPLIVKLADLPIVKTVDRLLGAIISVIIYCFFVVLFAYVIALPIFENGDEIINNSLLNTAGQISNKVFTSVSLTVNDIVDTITSDDDISVDQVLEYVKEKGLTKESITEFMKEYKLSIDDVTNMLNKYGLTLEDIAKEYNIDLTELLDSSNNE